MKSSVYTKLFDDKSEPARWKAEPSGLKVGKINPALNSGEIYYRLQTHIPSLVHHTLLLPWFHYCIRRANRLNRNMKIKGMNQQSKAPFGKTSRVQHVRSS
jgi:hypothetical protein